MIRCVKPLDEEITRIKKGFRIMDMWGEQEANILPTKLAVKTSFFWIPSSGFSRIEKDETEWLHPFTKSNLTLTNLTNLWET